MSKAREILQSVWGYPDFRPGQEAIVASVLQGKDTLALLPTGAGKSICYQVPALALNKLCLVISPLIALMADQQRELAERNIRAEDMSGKQTAIDIDRILDNCRYGYAKFLFVSPERLINEELRERLAQLPIGLIAVDEAHCISQWGYNFRPAYLRIGELRKDLPQVPVLALTATATARVILDIQEKLHFRAAHCIRRSFVRPNLAYQVRYTEDPLGDLEQLLHRNSGTSIVYAPSRRSTEWLAHELSALGHAATAYHAGLDELLRKERQAAWMKNKVRIMVATTAFGMGINKPDVRLVVHWQMAENLEGYFQEAGRAGRDGQAAQCVVLEKAGRTEEWYQNRKKEWPDEQQLKRVYELLCQQARIPIGEGEEMEHTFFYSELLEACSLSPNALINSLDLLQQMEFISYSLDQYQPTQFHFLYPPDEVYPQLGRSDDLLETARSLGRSYNGIFQFATRIDEFKLARFMEIDRTELRKRLTRLHSMGIGEYQSGQHSSKFQLLHPRLEAKYLRIHREFLQQRRKHYMHQIKAVRYFMSNNDLCRSVKVLQYLGEPHLHNCGQCDFCLREQPFPSRREIQQELIQLAENGVLPKLWHWNIPFHLQSAYWEECRYLVAEGRLTLA